jgi:hypothetical protein
VRRHVGRAGREVRGGPVEELSLRLELHPAIF